jgi:hypothetical protein
MELTGTERALTPLRYKAAYFVLVFAVSAWIFVIFVTPERASVGINQYERSRFLDMVEGTAYRPFVYRILLPATTRVISNLTPEPVIQASSRMVEGNSYLRKAFAHFGWETSAAYPYLVASALMLLSFMGFAHYTGRLAIRVCDVGDTYRMRALLAVGVLLGLPPFFSYTAFIYDPPQLFLFTLALFLLASQRIWAFVVTFGFCCLNKETAVLLLLVFAFTSYRLMSRKRYLTILIGLSVWYLLVRVVIAFVFRANPGVFVEFHLLDHNLRLLMMDWSFTDLVTCLVLVALVFYRWSEKPDFLRVSFVVVLAPMVVLSLFLGYLDEWRGYYEAYPLAFGLAVDTIRRLDVALGGAGAVV